MDSYAVVDQIVQSLSFEVEAVPKNKTVDLKSSSKSTPLNVKIRVRKKDDLSMRHGVISIPKFDDPEENPQKIRLINSDQTIMSFDVFMEAEFEKKPSRKPRKHIFDILKPGVCLGAPEDDDNAYMPSSSYSANVSEDNPNSTLDGVLKHNFTLSKNTYDDYVDPTKEKIFLGKCKPGGCLDPPFGEDRYSYKPVIKKTVPSEENTLKKESIQDPGSKCKGRHSSVFDSGIFKKKRKTSDQSTCTRGSASIKRNQSNSIINLYQVESTVNSMSTTQSNSIITYPPAIPPCEVPISDEKSRSRVTSEDKSRKSFNEFTDTYFIPPKGTNNIRDKNENMKTDTDDNTYKLQEIDKENKKTEPIDPIKVLIPIPIPVPIPIKSETVKYETTAPDVEKANVGDIESDLCDNVPVLNLENDIDKLLSSTDLCEQEKSRKILLTEDSNPMEAKYATIHNFDKIKQDVPFDTDSKHRNSYPVSISPQNSSKKEQKESLNNNALIESLHTKDSPEITLKHKNALVENLHAKDSPESTIKHEKSIIEEPNTKVSSRHSSKQEEGALNKNALVESLHAKDSPESTIKHEKSIIEEPHTKDNSRHSSKHKEEGTLNKNALISSLDAKDIPKSTFKHENSIIEEPHTKVSSRHSSKQEEGALNKNALVESLHTKDSPEITLKHKNALVENLHAKDSPESTIKHEKSIIEEPHTKDNSRHSSKQKDEGTLNKIALTSSFHAKDNPESTFKHENSIIEEPNTKDSSRHSSKQIDEGTLNKNALISSLHAKYSPESTIKHENFIIEEPHTKEDSSRHSSKQEEGALNKNALVERLHAKDSPESTLKHKSSIIEEPHTKDNSRHSSKQIDEGTLNKNAFIESLHAKDSPENTLKHKSSIIEEPHTKDSSRHSPKQKEEETLNKNALISSLGAEDIPKSTFKHENSIIEEPHTKGSSRRSSKQEEGELNKNALVERLHTKDSPESTMKHKNNIIEEPHTKDSSPHSSKQEEEERLNRNALIRSLHAKDNPESTFKLENSIIEEPQTKDISQRSSKQEEEGTANKNTLLEGLYAIDNPKNTFKYKNSIIEEPHTKDSSRRSSKHVEEGLTNKNALIERLHTSQDNYENTLEQELGKNDISEMLIPPKEDYVKTMDIAENAIDSFPIDDDKTHPGKLLDVTQEVDLQEKRDPFQDNKKAIAQDNENSIDLKFSQKSSSFSEPGIFKRQDTDHDSSHKYQNYDEIIPRRNDTEEDTNIKLGKNDNDLLESYNAKDDFLSAEKSSQIDRPIIKDDTDIIKQQLQYIKDRENTELSTGGLSNESRSYIAALATIDRGFRKLGSVNSEINLISENSIGHGNKEQYNVKEKQWKAALRTGGAELEDDHDSSASTSIIKSTSDKGVMSPDKRVVIPMYNTVSTETITKTDETPGDSEAPNNELDKNLSHISKSYVGSASVSSSIPSTSTLKSVLKKETVAVDLAFQSYLNEKNERVLKTFDTTAEPKRYINDSITLVKSQVRLSANEIRIPIDSENDMFIQIKKASVNQHVHISESELETGAKHDLKSSVTKYPHDIIDRDFLHDSLLEVYDQELVPLQIIIRDLKDEIDVLASQQMVFKEKVFSSKKSKPARVVHSNRRCGCLKKI